MAEEPAALSRLSVMVLDVKIVPATVSSPAAAPIEGPGLAPLSKVPAGVSVVLNRNDMVRLLYLDSGRIEKWTGPAEFRIGLNASRLITGAGPAESVVPAEVVAYFQRAPESIRSIRGGSGIPIVRSGDEALREAYSMTELHEALTEYKRMRDSSADDEVSPELYLLAVITALNTQPQYIPVLQNEIRKRNPDAYLQLFGR